MIKFQRTQLEQTAKHIKKISKENREELTQKFANHVDQLKAYFDDYKKRQSEILNDALVFQEGRVEDVIAEVDEHLEKLDIFNSNLSSLEYHEDNVLISMNDIIEDLYKGMMKFSPDINLEGLKIDIDVDDDIIQRIDKILTRSAELMHGNFNALDGSDRTTETYRDLVKNMWNCITCGA